VPGVALRTALALYVALHGVADPMAGIYQEIAGLVMGLATWMLLAPDRSEALHPAAQGTIVAAALCVTLVLLPYATGALPVLSLGPGVMDGVQIVGVRAHARGIARLPSPARADRRDPGARHPLDRAARIDGRHRRARVRSPAAAIAVDSSARRCGAPAPLPDVFVLVLDTVRADHLSTTATCANTTPKLAQFLSEHPEAVQYDLAFAPASWTVPSHASLLTGTMPSRHGARSRKGESFSYSATRTLELSADRTLAELLSGVGYCTSAVVANAYLLRVDGLQRGFEAFFQPHPIRPLQLIGQGLRRRFTPAAYAGWIKPYPRANVIDAHVVRMLRECGSRPAFVLANFMDAHSPYLAPSPHSGLFAGNDQPAIALDNAVLTDDEKAEVLKRDRYDEDLHFLDEWLGRLFAVLAADDALDPAWVFITADHGESFREHGTSAHGSSIYNEQVRIPLIVKPPRGVALPRTREPVSLLDVTATIAAIAGHDGFGVGHDLRAEPPADRVVEVEFRGGFRNNPERFGATSDEPARAAIRGGWKLLERSGSYELYDLASDLRELHDHSAERADVLQALAPQLPDLRLHDEEPARTHQPRELTRDERDALHALGYVE
jgi:arylsulfatase A-like enzyme